MLRPIAALSGIYDAAVGLFLLVAAPQFAAMFGVAPAQPPIFADLNGLFLLAVGVGYYFPYRDPLGARWYLWVMGPGLKGAGAAAFLLDYSCATPLPRSCCLPRATARSGRGADASSRCSVSAAPGSHSRPARPAR